MLTRDVAAVQFQQTCWPYTATNKTEQRIIRHDYKEARAEEKKMASAEGTGSDLLSARQAIEHLTSTIQDLQTQNSSIQKTAVEKLERERQSLTKEIHTLKQTLSDSETKYSEKLQDALKKEKYVIKKLSKTESDAKTASRKASEQEKIAQQLRLENDTLKKNQATSKRELVKQSDKIQTFEQQIHELQECHNSLKSCYKEAEQQISENKTMLVTKIKELEACQQAKEALDEKLRMANSTYQFINKHNVALQGKCAELETSQTNLQNDIREQQVQLQDVGTQLKEATSREQNLSAALTTMETNKNAAHARVDLISKRHANLETLLSETETQLKKAIENHHSATEQLEEAQNGKLRVEESLQACEKAIDDELRNRRQLVATLENTSTRLDSATEDNNTLTLELDSLKSTLEENKTLAETLQGSLQTMSETKSGLEFNNRAITMELNTSRAQYNNAIAELKTLQDANEKANQVARDQKELLECVRCDLQKMTIKFESEAKHRKQLMHELEQCNQHKETDDALFETQQSLLASKVQEASQLQSDLSEKDARLKAAETERNSSLEKFEHELQLAKNTLADREQDLKISQRSLAESTGQQQLLQLLIMAMKTHGNQLETAIGYSRFSNLALSTYLCISRDRVRDLATRSTALSQAFTRCMQERNAMYADNCLLNQEVQSKDAIINGQSLRLEDDAFRFKSIAIALGLADVSHDRMIHEIQQLQDQLLHARHQEQSLQAIISGPEGFRVQMEDLNQQLIVERENVTDLRKKISEKAGIEDKLTASEAAVKAQKQIVSELQDRISGPTGFKNMLCSAETQAQQVESQMTQMKSTISGLSQASANLKVALSETKELRTTLALRDARIAHLKDCRTQLDRAKDTIKTFEHDMINLNDQLQTAATEVSQIKSENASLEAEVTTMSSRVEATESEISKYQEELKSEKENNQQLRRDYKVTTIARDILRTEVDHQAQRIKILNSTRVSILKALDNFVVGYIRSDNAYGHEDWAFNAPLEEFQAASNTDVEQMSKMLETMVELIQSLRRLVKEQKKSLQELKDCQSQLEAAKKVIWLFHDLLDETHKALSRKMNPMVEDQIMKAMEQGRSL